MVFVDVDVLIIGSGIAGCSAALHLADAGLSVMMLTKASEPYISNTYYSYLWLPSRRMCFHMI